MTNPKNPHQVTPSGAKASMPTDKELDALIVERQKSHLRELSEKTLSAKGYIVASLIALIYLLALAFFLEKTLFGNIWFYPVLLAGALLGGLLLLGFARLIYKAQERALERQTVQTATRKLQEELELDFFTNLVKINFKYIDKYYLQTQVQADRSFYLSCAASVFAFGVIVVGIVMLYRGKTEQGYVVAASGILGEFIASVFFYLYNRTVIKMGEYHQKLVLTQNISLALKISNDLPAEAQVDAKKNLIEYLSKDINLYLTRFPSDGWQGSSSQPSGHEVEQHARQ